MSASAHLFVFAGIILAVAIGLSALATYAKRSADGAASYPYLPAESLLTNVERAFFAVLREALSPEYHVFAKVRLADVIEVKGGVTGRSGYRAFNRISAKHCDFVACDPQTFRVIGVIELDDSSHHTYRRRQRDDFLDAALKAAAIPVVHIRAQGSYSAAAIRTQIAATFHPAPLPSQGIGHS